MCAFTSAWGPHCFPAVSGGPLVSGRCHVCHSCSCLLWSCDRSHRQRVREWLWLCADKTLFTRTGRGPVGSTGLLMTPV